MKLFPRIRALFQKRRLEREMAEEMRLHREQRIEEHVAAGLSPEEAGFAAQREFGHLDGILEDAREQREGFVVHHLSLLVQDVRYAFRQLRKARGFTTVVVLTLGLGIGATTAIVSVINGVLFDPIPVAHPEQLVRIGQAVQYPGQPAATPIELTSVAFPAVLAHQDFFADLTWYENGSLERRGDDFPVRLSGAHVQPNFFSFLGARPLLGRTFSPDEAVNYTGGVPDQDTVMILSHAWWQSEFGGNPAVLGTTVELSGRRFTIVGVMPAHFQFPAATTLYWVPTLPIPAPVSSPGRTSWRFSSVIARLKPGATAVQAQTMLQSLRPGLLEAFPAGDRSYGDALRSGWPGLNFWTAPLAGAFQDGSNPAKIRGTYYGFLAAIGFVLAIACANVANLTLARTEQRGHELAIRAALGAGRGRVARQLLTESILLAGLGGMAGLAVAFGAVKLLLTFSNLPRLRPVGIDGSTLGIALAVSGLVGIVLGLLPAWRVGRALGAKLAQGRAAGSRSRNLLRRSLIVAEVAVATVLLTGAGLMIQSVVRVLRVEPGYDVAHLLGVRVNLSGQAVPPGPQATEVRRALADRIHERLAGLPGVQAVGILRDNTSVLSSSKIVLEGRAEPLTAFSANIGIDGADFFRAARIPLLAGHYLESGDAGTGNGVVIVNQSFAAQAWPGQKAVGQTFRDSDRTYEVVGLVGDTRLYQFDEAPRAMIYGPFHDIGTVGDFDFIVRTQQDPVGTVAAIRSSLHELAPRMNVPVIEIYRQRLYDATQAQRTYRNYLGVLAGLGLVLSALGIYGLLAYSVVQRTREIGVRMALGASAGHIMALISREAVQLTLAGAGIGLLASYWLSQLLRGQLYQVSPHDPVAMGLAVLTLLAVALLACWLPARRAAKVDPMVALRAE